MSLWPAASDRGADRPGRIGSATKPTVTTISPTAGKTGVATSANVLATFSEPMRAATVIKSTVKVVRKGTTKSLAATLTYDAARRRATLNPTSALARGAVYTATVSTGVRDAAGNPMAKARSWSFTVRR